MTKASLPRLHFALWLAIFLGWTVPAQATTVAILWPSTPSADVAQTLTLLRGELLSVGLEITMSAPVAARDERGTDSVAWLEALAARGVSAVIDPIGPDVLEAIDVWVVKTAPQRFEVTHVAVDPNAPKHPEMLALRAVEALRAGLLEIDWAARKRRDEPAAQPATTAPPADAPTRRSERVGLELGAVAVINLAGLSPAVSPILGVGWALRPWLEIQASGAALGSRSAVSTTAGTARVAQQYAVLGARYRFRASQRLWPFLGIGAGALRTAVAGQSAWGTGGQTLWSGLLDVNAGAGLRLVGRTYLTLAGHVQVADPYAVIHIADTVAATSGHPNLVVALTLGAWL